MFPCRNKSADTQVYELVTAMGVTSYGIVWINVETNPSPDCSWNSPLSKFNCQFVNDIVNYLKANGKTPGIYSNYYMWETIMGSAGSCTILGSLPLWYAHYDNKASYDDF